jgi:hypothetical protein
MQLSGGMDALMGAARTLDGNVIRLSDHRGNVVLLVMPANASHRSIQDKTSNRLDRASASETCPT